MTALIDGLMDDRTSHTFASAAGFSYVPAPEEVALYDRLDADIMMRRQKNQPSPQPLKRPWHEKRVTAVTPKSDADTMRRRGKLNERLGLPG